LCGEARRVANPCAGVGAPDAHGDVGEQRSADADENVRAQAGRFPRDLTLEPDRAAEDDGESELEEEIQAQRVRQLGE
jgi:hypothetical protein